MTGGLSVEALVAGHGAVAVVHEMTFAVAPGEVLAVLGPNGAGKTTMLETVAGLLPRLAGTVALNGVELPSGRPTAANRSGVVLVKDNRALFSQLTVEENLSLARRRDGPSIETMLELFPELGRRWKVAAGSLSGGEQQMLALARALVQEPRVLLVDEMSMGLAPVIVERLLPLVRRVASTSDVMVVLVEQYVGLALHVADRAIVMARGRIALSGSAADLAADGDALSAAYLGQVVDVPMPS